MPSAGTSETIGNLDLRPVLLAISIATVGVLPAFLTGGLAVQITAELGFGVAYLGLAVALFFTSAALSSVLMGRLVERVGSHAGMRLAAFVSAFSMVGVSLLATSWTLLVVFLVIGGFANSMSHPAANLSLAREVPANRQGLSFGIKQSAIPAATLLAGLAVPLVAVTLGWRWAFVIGAVLALSFALLVPKTEKVLVRKPKSGGGRVRVRALVVLTFGFGLGSMAATPLGSFVVSWAVESGIRVESAGLLLAAGSALSIFVRVVSGYLADGMQGGRLRIVAALMTLGTLGFALLATGIPYGIVAGTLIAFAAGWGWPGLFNFAVVKVNPEAPAAATGITQTGASSGAALGPLAFGLIVQTTSYGTAWVWCAALAVAGMAAILVGRNMLLSGGHGPSDPGGQNR